MGLFTKVKFRANLTFYENLFVVWSPLKYVEIGNSILVAVVNWTCRRAMEDDPASCIMEGKLFSWVEFLPNRSSYLFSPGGQPGFEVKY
ncbi:hypothetical protein R1flu_022756 [Riccia fluitans]|uniref:Uncharacterized protein n=1 Tax=Riccia fluitans TaxID=41844 RepID=A0ABD1XQ31_9MARC